MYHVLFIHSSIDEHLGCSHVLATVNSAACIFSNCGFFSGNMPSNRIAGSHGSFMFSFLRNRHPVLHSGCFSLLYFPSNRVARGFLTQGFILERGSTGAVFFKHADRFGATEDSGSGHQAGEGHFLWAEFVYFWKNLASCF